jgi:hypothetical protein
MILHKPTLPSGIMEDFFVMVEKPGLDVSNLGIHPEEDDDDLEVEADVE